MSAAEPTRYQPVTVEDWDDEAQASIPGTRTTANVAVKRDGSSESDFPSSLARYEYDGTDSGYASKAPTVSSMASSQRRRTSDLKLDTSIVTERERKPYAMTATPRDSERQPIRLAKEVKKAPEPIKKPFCHKEGICWVCDRFGFHFDPKDPPKDLVAPKKTVVKPSTPATQTTVQTPKDAAPKQRTEDVRPRPPARRTSSARPTSMYVASTPIQAPFQQYPAIHHGWPTAVTPGGVAYTSHPYVVSSTPVAYMPPQQLYFEPPTPFDDHPPAQPKPTRRLSMAIQERPVLEKKPSRTNTLTERVVSREQRPQMVSHASQKSINDRIAMPPPPAPPKPQHVTTVNTARPRAGRSNTYHSNTHSNRRSATFEDSSEDEDYLDPKAIVALDGRPSPRRPPSSWKPPTLQDIPDRPQLAPKSKSYQDGPNSVQVASTTRADLMPRRRTTDSMPTTALIEQQEAAAEAYMRKRGSQPLVELTADNLKSLRNAVPRHVSDQKSESGSTASHVTHHSSSKGSSIGRGRPPTSSGSAAGHSKGTSMNININGLNFAITDDGNRGADAPPVKLDLGGIQISMNNKDKENIDHRPKLGQRQLERSMSMSSRPSRRSLTQSSLISAATSGQRRENDELLAIEGIEQRQEFVRRKSHVEDDPEELELLRRASKRSSRQPSRNPSSVRQTIDELPVRSRTSNRGSVDYSLRNDPVM